MTYGNEAETPPHSRKLVEHPVGDAVGAAIGAAASATAVGVAEGAILGTAAGLPGMAVGVVIGGVVGGLLGNEVAESINPTVEDAYWRDNYKSRPYINPFTTYDDYAPAYHHGIKGYITFSGRKFDEMEPYLAMEWEKARGNSRLNWDDAKPAVHDAYERLYSSNDRKI